MGKRKDSRRIDEELVCVDSLKQCLRERCKCREVGVERVSEDPPDFWVTIDGVRYGGEVTSIVTQEGYHANCKRLERDIRADAIRQRVLRGRYVLLIRGEPRLPKRPSREWAEMVGDTVSFIRTTQTGGCTEEGCLLKNGRGHLRVKKVSDEGETVGLVRVGSAKWEGEIQDELYHQMQDAINRKREKLEKKGIPGVCGRIILLFYDAYGYGDIQDAQKALLRVDGYDWFHSIFWAASFTDRPNELSPENRGRIGYFLYSANERWWISRREPSRARPEGRNAE